MTSITVEQGLPPIEVTVLGPKGTPIPEAYVRATYTNSGLTSDCRSGEDGTALVPLLYCDKEPMALEIVARGHQAEDVGEYQPNKEHYKLLVTLPTLKSEWEQAIIPIQKSDASGSIKHPTLGNIQVSRSNFHISNKGTVSVNGSVNGWHSIVLNQKYELLMRDGTEITIRFLETNPGFSITLEHSPPKQHNCLG